MTSGLIHYVRKIDIVMQILIINQSQFGYHTDVFKWCQYLKDKYDVRVVCYDAGKPIVKMDGVNVSYAKAFWGNTKIRAFLFLLKAIVNLFFTKGVIIIEYYAGCAILKKIFPTKRIILDIRTLGINQKEELRERYNNAIKKSCESFKEVSVISNGVKEQLALAHDKTIHLLPLGADPISKKEKIYNDNLSLLYVGTLINRKIETTIEGLALYLKKCKDSNIEYHIVGSGNQDDIIKVKTAIESNHLQQFVHYHGYVQHERLEDFFERCNIGVSYVPITSYYHDQPPTKTFEYVLSGLFTIATRTRSNEEIINAVNGNLIDDDAESFCNALVKTREACRGLNDKEIRESLSDYTWDKIVENYLIPIIES